VAVDGPRPIASETFSPLKARTACSRANRGPQLKRSAPTALQFSAMSIRLNRYEDQLSANPVFAPRATPSPVPRMEIPMSGRKRLPTGDFHDGDRPCNRRVAPTSIA
jgi:hypothetical protein